ncbi:MAG: zinc-ribbon domain-containing protein [Aaplasma endosymbiont of Hyalomma asiaticum]
MIRVVCTNCGSMYSIASTRISQKDKGVTCKNCSTTWTPLPEEFSAMSENTRTKKGPPGTVSRYKKGSIWATVVQVAVMLPLLFFFSSSFQKNVPYKLRKIYRFAEIHDTSHVKLLKSRIKILGTKDKSMTVKVNWSIANESEEERFVPATYLAFYDKDGKAVAKKKLAVSKYDIISAGSDMHFEEVVIGIPHNAVTAKVRTGNALEILFY